LVAAGRQFRPWLVVGFNRTVVSHFYLKTKEYPPFQTFFLLGRRFFYVGTSKLYEIHTFFSRELFMQLSQNFTCLQIHCFTTWAFSQAHSSRNVFLTMISQCF
jgi:hypothetical protein